MEKKSLEDALAELEAKKAQTAEYLAKHAPEIEAETAKRNALSAKLAALSQEERRQVLDAMGLKHISAAPEPITPLKGSSYRPPNKPPEPPRIDWRHWRHMPEIRQWEACALSLNINPDNMKHHPQAWMAGPGSGPIFTDASFLSKAVQSDFDKRLRLLGASLFSSGYFTAVNNLVVGGRHLATLNLQEFAAWALHVEWEAMPPELVAMAETMPVVPTEPQATTPSPAPVVAVSASLTHSTKARRDTLTPVIELAQSQCRNPKDTAEVWAVLMVLAEKKHPPLIGATEEGLQYLEAGQAGIFKRKSLGARLTR